MVPLPSEDTFGFLKKAVKAAGKGVQAVGKATTAVGKTVGKVPIVGKGLKGAFDITVSPAIHVASDITKGKSINQVALNAVKRNVSAVQDVAPYAQMVISNVPGVGSGISGAIGASLALAQGQPITEALATGVRDALPGGPLAKSAFNLGKAAVQGKPIDKAIISALPIPEAQKKLIVVGLGATKDLAKGKKLSDVIVNQGQGALPPDIRKALNIGVAIGNGQNIQKIVPQTLKAGVIPSLEKGGINLIKASPMLSAAGKVLDPSARKGYATAVGLMAKKVSPIQLTAIHSKLTPQERRGFDIGVATKIGMTTKAPPKTANPAQQFGYYTAAGLKEAPNAQKTALLKTIAKQPATLAGAAVAVKEAKAENAPWWKKVLRYVGIKVV